MLCYLLSSPLYTFLLEDASFSSTPGIKHVVFDFLKGQVSCEVFMLPYFCADFALILISKQPKLIVEDAQNSKSNDTFFHISPLFIPLLKDNHC